LRKKFGASGAGGRQAGGGNLGDLRKAPTQPGGCDAQD